MVALFDLDGVLLDSESRIKLIWEQLLPASRCSSLWGRCLGVNQLAEQRLFQLTVGWSPDRYQQFLREVAALSPVQFPLRQGAVELVHNLRNSGVRVGIVTSRGAAELSTIMRLEDWSQLKAGCDTIVTGDMGLASKPDPAPYLFAMRSLHIQPNRCVVVEDAPNGINSALSAGAYVIALEDTVILDGIRHKNLVGIMKPPLVCVEAKIYDVLMRGL